MKITSSLNDTHTFSWDMLAFRYFGNSDGVIIKCRVLICTNFDDSPELSDPQCSRCGQLPSRLRKRRALNGDDARIVESVVTSGPIFIVNTGGKHITLMLLHNINLVWHFQYILQCVLLTNSSHPRIVSVC